MKVLLAAAECSPLARTGGLGEVVAGLGRALIRLGVDVTIVIPRYRGLRPSAERVPAPAPAEGIYRTEGNGVPILLVDDPVMFDRAGIYGPEPGSGYDDQWKRYGRFSNVVRELGRDYDVLHLHDSHVGPAALDSPTPTVGTVHNASYAVMGPLEETADLVHANASDRALGGSLEWFGQAHFLKALVDRAHAVTTVSPTFALQLLSDPSISNGLDTVFDARATPVIGILNGIDWPSWDPASDPVLPAPFTPGRLGGRADARAAIGQRSGLADGGFLLGAVTRVTEQKGIGLLDPYIDRLVSEGVQLAIVGNGDLDEMVDAWAARHPTAVWHAEYDESLARVLYAGVDAYLMPSRFEPCGIGQMYAMRYGAPPIARLTGGLADTVRDLDEHPASATGFGFRSFNPESLVKTIRRAMRVHAKHRGEWRKMQRNGMGTDFSWDGAARRYVEVYESVL